MLRLLAPWQMGSPDRLDMGQYEFIKAVRWLPEYGREGKVDDETCRKKKWSWSTFAQDSFVI
jgi:hypothetical protein